MDGNMTLDESRYKKVAVWRQKETKKSACALFPLEQSVTPCVSSVMMQPAMMTPRKMTGTARFRRMLSTAAISAPRPRAGAGSGMATKNQKPPRLVAEHVGAFRLGARFEVRDEALKLWNMDAHPLEQRADK